MVAPCWRSIASDFARLSSERQMPEEWQSSGEEFFPRTGRVKDGLAQCHVFECINNPLSLSELGLVLFPPPPFHPGDHNHPRCHSVFSPGSTQPIPNCRRTRLSSGTSIISSPRDQILTHTFLPQSPGYPIELFPGYTNPEDLSVNLFVIADDDAEVRTQRGELYMTMRGKRRKTIYDCYGFPIVNIRRERNSLLGEYEVRRLSLSLDRRPPATQG